jgi:hypothetical protein
MLERSTVVLVEASTCRDRESACGLALPAKAVENEV